MLREGGGIVMQKKNVKTAAKGDVIKKEVAKKDATKPVIAETKVEEVKVAEVKTPEVKTPEVKATAPKTPAKKAATKKTATKKVESSKQILVQYQYNEVDVQAVEEKVKAQFVAEGHRASAIKELKIYIKPEEYSAYYVINEKYNGRVDLFW